MKAKLLGDVNDEGNINIDELILLMEAYGSTSTSANWNPNADINDDGAVDIFDIKIISAHWGQSY